MVKNLRKTINVLKSIKDNTTKKHSDSDTKIAPDKMFYTRLA